MHPTKNKARDCKINRKLCCLSQRINLFNNLQMPKVVKPAVKPKTAEIRKGINSSLRLGKSPI